jgi:hypothetical protein
MKVSLLSNGRSWIHPTTLLASQHSFDNSLEVWSSFGHTRRWSLYILVFFSLHIVQLLWLRILMRWRSAARQSWPVLSRKCATACFLCVFLFFSPCSFNVLLLCLAGWGDGFLGELFVHFSSYVFLNCLLNWGWPSPGQKNDVLLNELEYRCIQTVINLIRWDTGRPTLRLYAYLTSIWSYVDHYH